MGAPMMQQGVRLSSSLAGQQFPQYIGQQPMQAAQLQRPAQTQPAQLQQVQQVQQVPVQQAQAPQIQQLQQAMAPPKATTPVYPGQTTAIAPGTTITSGVLPGTTIMQGGSLGAVSMLGGQPMTMQTLQQQQGLEARVRELEAIVEHKDEQIKELQALLTKAGVKQARGVKTVSKTVGASGFQKITGSKPQVRYTVADPNDPVDIRLEEFYNGTGSAVQFRRINHGFYRFGETIVELSIINHKLMARTEDGWNRNKFGPVEKFLMYYENIEREKAGIIPEA